MNQCVGQGFSYKIVDIDKGFMYNIEIVKVALF